MESLVDELCDKLRDLEGGDSNDDKDECRKTEGEPKTSLESLTPRDRALRYYAAFPALQPATPKKSLHRKEKNFGNTNINNIKTHGINNNNNNNKNTSDKARQRRKKMSIVSAKSRELRGYIHLCSRKEGNFYDFFLEKQFFFKTERLFIFTCQGLL